VLRFPSNRPLDRGDVEPTRLRDVIGDVLRDERRRQERTLADVAERAAVSLPYLSEVERGRKEVSSDLLDAIGTALDLPLVEILERSAERLRTDVRMTGRMVDQMFETSVRSGELRGESTTRFQLAA
jgi:transcriptional regulator with XRE-family HTH domain